MSDEIKVGMDPRSVLQACEDIQQKLKALSQSVEESLGKQAPKSIKKFEESAEVGTNRVGQFVRNLSTRIKEDLKTAFDIGSLASGLNIAKQLASGTKEVFEMEKAFARLNTRLGLSGDKLKQFKVDVGRAVAGTGQKLGDVLPGVETAAAQGNIKDPKQLSDISKALGQVRAVTNEDTGKLADTAINILKSRGDKINAQSIAETLDVMQATRKSGAFAGAADAGGAINEVSQFAKKLGLSLRETGALAAQTSKAGDAGQNILRQLSEMATKPGQQTKLNEVLGQQIFKNGKLDPSALGKVDVNKFGSASIMEEASGLSGNAGQDLRQTIEAFKGGMDNFQQVVKGSNETSAQFEEVAQTLSMKIDIFKQQAINAGREIGDGFSGLANALIGGDFQKAKTSLSDIGTSISDNKGVVAGAAAAAVGSALLAGGGANSLLKKIPGAGLAKGLVGGEIAAAAGAQKVYVVNAAEIGAGLGGMGGAGATGVMGKLAKGAGIGGLAAGAIVLADSLIGDQVEAAAKKSLLPSQGVAMDEGQMRALQSIFIKKGGESGTGQTFGDFIEAWKAAVAEIEAKKKPKIVQVSNPSSIQTTSPRSGVK